MMDALAQIKARADRELEEYGPLSSRHQALGLLLEEVRDLEDAIFDKASTASLHHEAEQVAARALRIMTELV